MEKAKELGRRLLDSGSARKWLLVLAAAGAALMLLSNAFHFDSPQLSENSSGFAVSDYRQTAQKDLEQLLSHIQGAGKTRVLLTVENSAEYVYLENGTTKTKEIQPQVRGVLVLCEGGDDPVTVGRVTEAVTKALDISTAKVCIEKLTE